MASKSDDSLSPTLKSIAEDLDTTVSSVSRVLNGKGSEYRIAETTQQRILDYARKVSYSPNTIARGLRMQKMHEIGLIVPDITDLFFSLIAECVTAQAQKRNYTVQISSTRNSTDLEVGSLKNMLNRKVDGLIICPVGHQFEHLQDLVGGMCPTVLIDRCFPLLELPQFATDNSAAGEEATAHLLKNGHRRIVCLQGAPGTSANVNRLEGYRRALRKEGITVDEDLILGESFEKINGYISVSRLLAFDRSFSAILALSSQVALGALRALNEAGLRIPEDISLVTFDDIDGVQFFATPLTTVSQPVTQIGEAAVRVLFDEIDEPGKHGVESQAFPARLIRRQSVKRI